MIVRQKPPPFLRDCVRTRFSSRPAGQNGSFNHILAALDPNLRVIDLDDVDQRAKIGLPEWRRSCCQVFTHGASKAFDQGRVDADVHPLAGFCHFEGRPRAVTISLETIEPLLQDVIEIGHSVFHKAVQPLEPLFGVCDFALKGDDALVLAVGFLGTPGAFREDSIAARRSG